jgi:hypothetical protein
LNIFNQKAQTIIKVCQPPHCQTDFRSLPESEISPLIVL